MKQIARNIVDVERSDVFDGVTHLIIDNDTRFAEYFRTTLKDSGIECVRIPPRSPNCSRHAERWVRVPTICLYSHRSGSVAGRNLGHRDQQEMLNGTIGEDSRARSYKAILVG